MAFITNGACVLQHRLLDSKHSRALIYDALPQLPQPSSPSVSSLSDSLSPTSFQALLFCGLGSLLYFSALPSSGFSPYLSPSPLLPLNTDAEALAHLGSSYLCNLPDSRRGKTQQNSSPPSYRASFRVSKTNNGFVLCITKGHLLTLPPSSASTSEPENQ